MSNLLVFPHIPFQLLYTPIFKKKFLENFQEIDYLCIMDIPLNIKRNYRYIQLYLNSTLDNYSMYIGNIQKEGFINKVCYSLSVWFSLRYSNGKLSIDEIKKYFIYLFRTKLSIYWEKQNGK